MKHPLAIYGSHDSNICVRLSSTDYRIYELERITGVRNYSLTLDPNREKVLKFMFDFLKAEHGIEKYDSIFYSEVDLDTMQNIHDIFDPAHFERLEHHRGHAYGAMWQSPYDKCLIISFDGGGNDFDGTTYFNIYEGDKKSNSLKKLGDLPLNICHAYTMASWPLSVIKKEGMESYLSWAGKIMGLVAYGRVIEEWIPAFKSYYYGHADMDQLKILFNKIGQKSGMNEIEDFNVQADIATTSQHVFENMFMEAAMPFILKSDYPLCLTGGGALNVLLNQKLYNHLSAIGKGLFVPPNPNDCGLSLGFLTSRYAPEGRLENMAYKGFPLMVSNDYIDYSNRIKTFQILEYEVKKYKDTFSSFFTGERISNYCSVKELAKHLSEGKIIGVAIGNSEVGPRALGNRSILCYPDSADQKDKINSKIKFREMFRPLSPVVLREDVNLFFGKPYESQFMTYSQEANSPEDFPAIVHHDGSSRVQTVSENQNPFLYELLKEVKELTGNGILLNTSFNSKGRPILTTVEEALKVLDETELDGVWINGYLFEK